MHSCDPSHSSAHAPSTLRSVPMHSTIPPSINNNILNRGRIIMDAETLPTIIPIWLSHFDKIMPEPRSFPRFVPRLLGPHQHLPQPVRPTITFGELFTFSPSIVERLKEYRFRRPSVSSRVPLGSNGNVVGGTESTMGLLSARDEVPSGMMGHRLDEAGVLKLRSDITSELQNALRALGESVNVAGGRKERS